MSIISLALSKGNSGLLEQTQVSVLSSIPAMPVGAKTSKLVGEHAGVATDQRRSTTVDKTWMPSIKMCETADRSCMFLPSTEQHEKDVLVREPGVLGDSEHHRLAHAEG